MKNLQTLILFLKELDIKNLIQLEKLLNILKDYWRRKNTSFYLLITEQVKQDFLVNLSL